MNFELLKAKALKYNISEIEVHHEVKSGADIEVFHGEVDSSTSFSTSVCSIRAVYEGKVGLYYTENMNFTEDSYDEILNIIVSNAKCITSTEPYFIYEGDKNYPNLEKKDCDFDDFSMNDKIKFCLKLEELILNRNELVYSCSGVSYSESKYTYTITNSNGLSLQKHGGFASLAGQAVIKKGEETKSDYEYQVVVSLNDLDLEKIAEGCVDRAVMSIGGEPISSKQYPVVLENTVANNLFMVYSSIFSAESVIRKTTFLADKINDKVFGDNITIIDDPMFDRSMHMSAFDDEGVASRPKTLVENGVFKTFLHNLKTAKMLNCESTGNGYKSSIRANVGVSPHNLYIKPGEKSFDELLSMANGGILITNLQGLHAGVNPITGAFNLQASGFMIEDGKLGKPVNLIVLSGNIKDVLNNVVEVGNDLEFKSRVIASPSLFISSMSVSGKN